MTSLTAVPTLLSALDASRQLAAVAATHAEDGERQFRLAAPVVDALVASRLTGLVAPTALGGDAANPATIVEVVETVAKADASTGWCLAVGIGSNHLAGYLPESGARELFTDVNRPASAVLAPTGRATPSAHGYRLSGRWPFASGCLHAAVQVAGMFVFDEHGRPELNADGAPIHRLAVVRASSLRIHRTWDTVGLRATGSHDTEVADVALSPEHVFHFNDAPWSDDVIYHQPAFAILAPTLSSVPLGIGRAALDAAEARACAEYIAPRPGPRTPFGDDVAAQQLLGEAEVRLRAARSLLLDVLDDGYQRGLDGDPTPRRHTALVALACREAMEAGGHAVAAACRIAGTSSVRQGSPLERYRRDVETVRQHVLFSPAVGAPLARQLAGIPTVAAPFLTHPVAGS